jgi:hypothetical protein
LNLAGSGERLFIRAFARAHDWDDFLGEAPEGAKAYKNDLAFVNRNQFAGVFVRVFAENKFFDFSQIAQKRKQAVFIWFCLSNEIPEIPMPPHARATT